MPRIQGSENKKFKYLISIVDEKGDTMMSKQYKSMIELGRELGCNKYVINRIYNGYYLNNKSNNVKGKKYKNYRIEYL